MPRSAHRGTASTRDFAGAGATHNPKVAGSNPAPATMNDEGLADVEAANPFRLPRLHPGIGFNGRALASERVSLKFLKQGFGVSQISGVKTLRKLVVDI